MFKCVSVLVAVVCLSAPSIGRSWRGSHDLTYDIKDDYNDYKHKSWVAEPNNDRHRSNHGWGHDYGSSEEDSSERRDDYQDYHPGLGSPPVTSSSTSSPIPAVTQPPPTSTTISSLVLQDIVRCIRDCPATPEFNPVCGTNNVTYNNLGILECTRNCGVNVALKRRSPCPQPLPQAYFISVPMLSTELPIVNAPAVDDKNNPPIARSPAAQTTLSPITVKPTRFTNIQNDRDSGLNIDRRIDP